MKVGLTLPQGCDREYIGLEAGPAWDRTVEVAREAERLGFGSLWAYDHFQVDPPPEPALVFEPFVELAALAMATSRAHLGHLVMAAAYRPAALTAKMISTLDVVSGGRAILGIGAGWKEDEWRSYGYGFPDAPGRLAILSDHLEVITRMLAPGTATYEGRHASVFGAIHEPKGIQPHIPVVIGGNGPSVTWRLAARSTSSGIIASRWSGRCRSSASDARRSGATRPRSPFRSTSGVARRPSLVRPCGPVCANTKASG